MRSLSKADTQTPIDFGVVVDLDIGYWGWNRIAKTALVFGKPMSENANVMPCGCRKEMVKRLAVACNEDGTPKFKDGAFEMEEVEEIQESYCSEHTGVLIERQAAAQRALADGKTNEALRLMAGATPYRLLEAPDDDDNA